MSDVPPPPPPPSYGGGANPAYSGPPLAELGPRVVAYLIDWVAPWFAVFIASAIIGVVSDALGFLVGLLGYLAVLGFEIWNVVQEGTTGQTIGKKQQNVRLIGLENGGQPVGAGNAIVRALVNSIPCGLGWLFPLFDPQRQTLGDKVSKSVVTVA